MADTILIDHGTITVLPAHVRAMNTHGAAECAGRECVVHNPTDHSMRTFPLHWRGDRQIFERLCPHGVGHPDPDQRAYWREQAERGEITDEIEDDENWHLEPVEPKQHVAAQMVHGCDGCCGGAS